jgi:hypothetical protein
VTIAVKRDVSPPLRGALDLLTLVDAWSSEARAQSALMGFLGVVVLTEGVKGKVSQFPLISQAATLLGFRQGSRRWSWRLGNCLIGLSVMSV